MAAGYTGFDWAAYAANLAANPQQPPVIPAFDPQLIADVQAARDEYSAKVGRTDWLQFTGEGTPPGDTGQFYDAWFTVHHGFWEWIQQTKPELAAKINHFPYTFYKAMGPDFETFSTDPGGLTDVIIATDAIMGHFKDNALRHLAVAIASGVVGGALSAASAAGAAADDAVAAAGAADTSGFVENIVGATAATDAASSAVTSAISAATGGASLSFGSVASDIASQIGSTLVDSGSVWGKLGQVALAKLEDSLLGSNSKVNDALARVIGGINDTIQKGGNVFDSLGKIAVDAITKTAEDSAGIYTSVFRGIGDEISKSIDASEQANKETAAVIQKGIAEQAEQSKELQEQTAREISDEISALSTASDSALAVTRDAIEKTGSGTIQATADAADQISSAVDRGFAGAVTGISGVAGIDTPLPAEEIHQRMNEAFQSLMNNADCPPDFAAFMSEFVGRVAGVWNPIGGAVTAYGLIEMYKSILDPVMAVVGNCLAQTAARIVPTSLPGAGELREMLNRELIDDNEAIDTLLRQGFNLDRATHLLNLRKNEPQVGIVQAWYLRGFVTPDRAVEMLKHLGYDAESVENLLKMSFFVPPVQDLISMAVREVFTPAIAEKYGQNEDFPDIFATYARLQGVDQEWARRYWAAHWSLPGIGQIFEMFQRGVINRGELDTALRAVDVMPYWRDKLTAIAYRPLARVDLRRLQALGLIDRDELQKRYQDIGYSPSDARLLATFTVQLNDPTASDDVNSLVGITRAMALKLYGQGVFTEEQTRTVLKKAKVSTGAQNVLLRDIDIEREIKHREQMADIVIANFKAGNFGYNEAHARLSGLGLTATELDHYTAKLEVSAAAQTRLPTKGDLDKLHDAKVIGDVEYLGMLETLGYPLVWATKFLELQKKTPPKTKQAPP